jgi:hypothetical protein
MQKKPEFLWKIGGKFHAFISSPFGEEFYALRVRA